VARAAPTASVSGTREPSAIRWCPRSTVVAHTVGRHRIVRAFLIEEQKIVKKVLKAQQAAAAAAK
jgi:hypothetical protein